jgi:hypothetical protein
MTVAAILAAITTYGPIVFSVIGAASAAASVAPKPGDNQVWNTVRATIDVLALNLGNAKNAE